MKKLQTKLLLNKQTLSVLTAQELTKIRGGQLATEEEGGDEYAYVTSIGHRCSCRNFCDRVLTQCSN